MKLGEGSKFKIVLVFCNPMYLTVPQACSTSNERVVRLSKTSEGWEEEEEVDSTPRMLPALFVVVNTTLDTTLDTSQSKLHRRIGRVEFVEFF